MFEKFKYKKYLNNENNIIRVISPDHIADCLEIGHVRTIKFNSGNTYKMRLIKVKQNKASTWHSPLYDGVYEMTNDIQPLTYEQFLSLIE